MKLKAAASLYGSLDAFMADITLLVKNCRTYNRPDTEYVACANKLELFAKARAAQVFGLLSGGTTAASAAAAASIGAAAGASATTSSSSSSSSAMP